MKVQTLFPEGKIKALTFSYDDGNVADRRLVEIFNRYGMKGTFNLCSFHLTGDNEGVIHQDEAPVLYRGHEIACHGTNHYMMERIPAMAALDEIYSNRKQLETMTGSVIGGFAYPYGTYSRQLISTLKTCGIKYARTVASTHSFSIPDDFLECHPTCHHKEDLDAVSLNGTGNRSLCSMSGVMPRNSARETIGTSWNRSAGKWRISRISGTPRIWKSAVTSLPPGSSNFLWTAQRYGIRPARQYGFAMPLPESGGLRRQPPERKRI